MKPPSPLKIHFDQGTLILDGPSDILSQFDYLRHDRRTENFRCYAYFYSQLVLDLRKKKISYQDHCRQYNEISLSMKTRQSPRSFQKEALEKWLKQRWGYVVLPTGSGKSFLALMAMEKVQRSTLVIVPTLDLMNQWYSLIETYFGWEPGLIGGGYYEIKEITITTYDSAWTHMEHLGNRFGFLIFDECHHLPGESYSFAAKFAIAPFRLGLTATPERSDGKEEDLKEYLGKEIYRKRIKELAGSTLSEYQVRKVFVGLTAEEEEEYRLAREEYLQFIRKNSISFSHPKGWDKFIRLSCRSEEGRKAFQAYLRQKQILQSSRSKFQILLQLLKKHCHDKIIIFTNDNATVYEISKSFLLPAITHQTKIKERKALLDGFQKGDFHVIVTSKVLNEGVDLPEANVGIVLSGSGSVREHVQRLGRLLRKKEGKEAILYEVVVQNSSEVYTSQRRGDHEAYQ